MNPLFKIENAELFIYLLFSVLGIRIKGILLKNGKGYGSFENEIFFHL